MNPVKRNLLRVIEVILIIWLILVTVHLFNNAQRRIIRLENKVNELYTILDKGD